MLSQKYLEDLISAWPNDDGHSSNPEIYDAWVERERRYNARIIQNALGHERIIALSEKQKSLLELRLARLLAKKDVTLISDEEILGQYELVTEHFLPHGVEELVTAYNKRRQLN